MPLVICRILARHGNSSGGLKEYWDIFYSGTNAQGAFVWDWVDSGHPQAVPGLEARCGWLAIDLLRLRRVLGGSHGVRHDGNFCQNGCLADRVPHPGLGAIKYVYRYLHAAPADLAAGTNHREDWFDEINPRTSSRADGHSRNGRVMASGPLPEIRLAPRQQKTLSLGLPALTAEPGVE